MKTLSVRVRPGAAKSQIRDTLEDGTLKIDLAAVAEDGEANAELIRFLAEEYGVDKTSVEIVSGWTSRKKVVRISM